MYTEAITPETESDFNLYKPRIYVVFLDTHIPLWTPLLKMGLRWYQGSFPRFTHVSVCVAVSPNTITWIELDFFQSSIVVSYSEVIKVAHNADEQLLSILQTHHNGEPTLLNAVDVTDLTSVSSMQLRLYIAEGFDCNISPCTLAKHLIPSADHNTWTCTGLASYLVGAGTLIEMMQYPPSPDQLYETLLDD